MASVSPLGSGQRALGRISSLVLPDRQFGRIVGHAGQDMQQEAWHRVSGAFPDRSRRRPAYDVASEHRPPARHEVVLVRIIQGQPAVSLIHGPGAGGLVPTERGPPALAILLVPRLPLPLQHSRAGRLSHVGQGDGTATPSARATLGETVLSQHPERSRRRRRAQPARPGDLGAACFRLVKHLIDES